MRKRAISIVLIFLFIIGLKSCVPQKAELVKTNAIDFFHMVQKGFVEKFSVFEERKTVEVYLTYEAFRMFKQQGVQGFANKNLKDYGPHMQFKITSGYQFAEELNNFYKANPEAKRVSYYIYMKQ